MLSIGHPKFLTRLAPLLGGKSNLFWWIRTLSAVVKGELEIEKIILLKVRELEIEKVVFFFLRDYSFTH